MSDSDGAPAAGTPPRKRSPNFPGIALPKAIERAREVYDKAQQHPVPVTTIVKEYWGYSSTVTGPATQTYAALKRYGLLADEGTGDDRVARLTDSAVDVLFPNPNRAQAVQQAALAPSIFREWWERYGTDLPPFESLRYEHVLKGPFAEDGLASFLRVYRETVAFAELTKEAPPELSVDTDTDQGDGSASDDRWIGSSDSAESRKAPPNRVERVPRNGVVSISLPLPGFAPDEPVVIEFPNKLSEQDWDYFIAVITAMKAGIVGTPDPPQYVDLDDAQF